MVNFFDLQERSLNCGIAQNKAETHVEHLSLKIYILDPYLSRFHVLANVLDSSLKKLLQISLTLWSKLLLIFLVELKIASPKFHL